MKKFTRTFALACLVLVCATTDGVIWFLWRIPVVDTTKLNINLSALQWHLVTSLYLIIRLLLTAISVWLFFHFKSHYVAANREEVTKIVTKG